MMVGWCTLAMLVSTSEQRGEGVATLTIGPPPIERERITRL